MNESARTRQCQINRRTDAVGIFPNDGAGKTRQVWQLQRRDMQLEGLKVVSDNHAPGVVLRVVAGLTIARRNDA